MSIDMMTPRDAALRVGEISKNWISYRESHIKARQNTYVISEIVKALLVGWGKSDYQRDR